MLRIQSLRRTSFGLLATTRLCKALGLKQNGERNVPDADVYDRDAQLLILHHPIGMKDYKICVPAWLDEGPGLAPGPVMLAIGPLRRLSANTNCDCQ